MQGRMGAGRLANKKTQQRYIRQQGDLQVRAHTYTQQALNQGGRAKRVNACTCATQCQQPCALTTRLAGDLRMHAPSLPACSSKL
jgi:hypothetical protein